MDVGNWLDWLTIWSLIWRTGWWIWMTQKIPIYQVEKNTLVFYWLWWSYTRMHCSFTERWHYMYTYVYASLEIRFSHSCSTLTIFLWSVLACMCIVIPNSVSGYHGCYYAWFALCVLSSHPSFCYAFLTRRKFTAFSPLFHFFLILLSLSELSYGMLVDWRRWFNVSINTRTHMSILC